MVASEKPRVPTRRPGLAPLIADLVVALTLDRMSGKTLLVASPPPLTNDLSRTQGRQRYRNELSPTLLSLLRANDASSLPLRRERRLGNESNPQSLRRWIPRAPRKERLSWVDNPISCTIRLPIRGGIVARGIPAASRPQAIRLRRRLHPSLIARIVSLKYAKKSLVFYR